MVLSVKAAERNTILEPGDMLGGYRIESFLGRGGFGVTYLALDTQLDLLVAIKEYLPEQIAERTLNKAVQPKSDTESSTFNWGLSRFIKEAQTLAKFKHPSIVRVMAVFEKNGTAYMVMEYERGRELTELIGNRDMCTEANLLQIIGPVIDGLAEVHRHGYIHRDIKPANILIRDDWSPVLLDFGSARLAIGAQTQSLTALVSVGYAPLEQYNEANDSQQGPWTDVYALGAVLYFAITGNVPIDSTLRGSAVVNDEPDPLIPLVQLAPDQVSSSFCRAIDWALNFRIRDRPQTLEQWRPALFGEVNPDTGKTVLMPPAITRQLDPELLSPDGHTARNQVIDTYISGQNAVVERPEPTDRSRVTPTGRQADRRSRQRPADVSDYEPAWDTAPGRDAQQRRPRSRPAMPARNPRRKKSKAPLIIGLCVASMTVLAVGLKDHWLPHAQGLLSGSSDTWTKGVDAGGQSSPAIDARATTSNAKETVVTPTNGLENPEATAQQEAAESEAAALEKQSLEAARQREQELQKRQIEEAEARLAAEQQQREKEQAAADAARQEAERAAAEADRIARDRATQLAQEAARQARADARQAAAEAKRLAEEQAVKERESEKQILEQKEQLALLEEQQLAAQPQIDATRPITDADIKSVLDKFNNLHKAIIYKDEAALDSLTLPSERINAYLKYLFRTFDTIEVSLGGVGASPSEQTVRANLRIIRMKRSNGDIVHPPPEFKTIPIHSIRTNEWSRIHW